jgi:hypothetical protein
LRLVLRLFRPPKNLQEARPQLWPGMHLPTIVAGVLLFNLSALLAAADAHSSPGLPSASIIMQFWVRPSGKAGHDACWPSPSSLRREPNIPGILMRTQSDGTLWPPLLFLDLFLVLARRDLAIIYYGTKRIITLRLSACMTPWDNSTKGKLGSNGCTKRCARSLSLPPSSSF